MAVLSLISSMSKSEILGRPQLFFFMADSKLLCISKLDRWTHGDVWMSVA